MQNNKTHPARLPLRFVRHGATAANLAGVRCGGDIDLKLSEQGRAQAIASAQHLAQMQPPIGLIVTSDLKRTRETAAYISAALPGVPLIVEPDFGERKLGEWNLWPIAATQPWLEARMTPPGGESEEEFANRIARGLRRVKGRLHERPLLVGSKGVARILGELVGLPERLNLGNGAVAEFDLADRPCLATTWSAL